MRVKSALICFFNNRLVKGSGILIAVLFIFFTASSFRDGDLRLKQVNVIIRQIGHQLLLQAGDSTSRVLPVTESKGTFVLKFEKALVFNHDSLMKLSKALLPKAQFPSGYIVTVHDCTNKGIVYGFQLSNNSPDVLACRGRSEPKGCYTIEFTFPDFYVNIGQMKDENGKLIASANIKPQELGSKPEDPKTTTFDSDIDTPAQEIQSVKNNLLKSNPKSQELKMTGSAYPISKMVYAGMLMLLGIGLVIWRSRKTLKPLPVQNENHAIVSESMPDFPALGKFLFDAKGQRLLLGGEVISLTDKECKVLKLLNNNFGELIHRDTLMQEVWINEGVITGRSLDMFVSKLRKKLSTDPDLRITNIHGKGYRLEIVDNVIA